VCCGRAGGRSYQWRKCISDTAERLERGSMQRVNTGFRDKTGTEVFTGDVLEFSITWINGDGYRHVHQVVEQGEDFRLDTGYRVEFRAGNSDRITRENGRSLRSMRMEYGRVIGTAQDNPELLTA